jgi:hypothetical protein
VVIDDLLATVADDRDYAIGTQVDEPVETVRQQRLSSDLDHALRFLVGEWAESSALTRRENDCVHMVQRTGP